MNELENLAEKFKNEHSVKPNEIDSDESLVEQFEIEEEDLSGIVDDDTDDDDPVIIGGVTSSSSEGDDINEDDLLESDEFVITDEDLKAEMPALDDATFAEASSKIRMNIDAYRKNLIIRSGLTIQEANEAAMNRMKKLSNEENTSYLEENPNIGIVEIDKKNVDKVEFTSEEREKLVKVKSIKLKVVEDVNLNTLKIERVDKNHKAALLQTIDTNLSQYSVPLPLMSDYCRFKGSQIIQLIQAVRYEDATLDEVISNKASLIYNQLVSGFNLDKYDDNGKIKMNYQEFANKFLLHDIDMALFGILVASSMEDIETTLTCGDCNARFQWKYNIKSLLSLDELSDDFKERIDTILKNKTNEEELHKMYDKYNKTVRVQSPITNNIYDLNYPTIARAANLYRLIDQSDETMIYLSAFAIFIGNMYVYNKKTDKYVQIEEDEYRYLLDVLQMLPQEEINIIQNFLKPYLYAPKFILKSTCPSCGFKMQNELSIEELVFLKARDSSTEIQ